MSSNEKEKIDGNELKNIIVNELKEQGINDLISNEKIEEIKQDIEEAINNGQNLSELEIPDKLHAKGGGTREFPEAQFPDEKGLEKEDPNKYEYEGVGKEAGEEPTGQEEEPTRGYEPELPKPLQSQEPAKLFIFDENELSEGGEKLASKKFKTVENPEEEESIKELWMEEGKVQADVYIAKMEKIGNIKYDFRSGTATFNEESEQQNSEETYNGEEGVQQQTNNIDMSELKSHIQSSIDMEGILSNMITNVIKNFLSQRGINNAYEVTHPDSYSKELDERNYGVPEGNREQGPSGRFRNSHERVDQKIKPMEESKDPERVTMKEITNPKYKFKKIKAPEEVQNILEGKEENKGRVINETNDAQTIELDGKKYYAPKEPLSTEKCYIKENEKEDLKD